MIFWGCIASLIGLSAYIYVTEPLKLGLDLKGGVRLVLEARPTKDQHIDLFLGRHTLNHFQ